MVGPANLMTYIAIFNKHTKGTLVDMVATQKIPMLWLVVLILIAVGVIGVMYICINPGPQVKVLRVGPTSVRSAVGIDIPRIIDFPSPPRINT